MCGICGTAGFTDEHLLQRMVTSITHRGPDDRGIFVSTDRTIGLGNCRLSIIDLSSAGHMPMCNEDGTIWLTYNGEVYNFRELRAELSRRGHVFRSHTDSEVILHGYEEWGLRVLARLNGMFAFALVDSRQSAAGAPPQLVLARDRFGIKPLYYTVQQDQLVFASEIKALLLVPSVPREMNFEALHRYLTFLWVPGPETLFAGIQKLPPGHYLLWQQGVQTIQQYWDPAFLENSAVDERETVEELRSILRRSVERHLISDVPLGVFLSGGIDSSTILALATEIQGQPLTAYTIAFRDSDSPWEQSTDDARYARQVARHFRADFHEITAEPDMVELLPKVVLHLDEPVADPAAILTYLICDAARPQLKVLLSGQGGDEIFAGYRVHLTHALGNALRHIPRPIRNGVGRSALALLQRWKQKIPGVRVGLAMAAHRFLEKTLRGTDLPPEERYVFNRSYFTDRELLDLYSPELRQHLQGTVAGEKHLAYFERVPNQDFINRMLYVDQKTFLPELNLTYSDKLSAAVSVEIRVPFLDAELVEFVAQIPARWKLKGTTSKYILKAAMKSTLTPDVIRRRKASFGAPIRSWLRRDLREMVDELLSERSLRQRGLFDPGRIRSLIEQDRAGHEDHAYRIWTFLTLELWNRTFLDAGGYPGAKAEPTLSAAALTNRHL